jgi:hypothetical protein
MSNFYNVIDHEVLKSIPLNWRLVPEDKLLGKSPYKIRYAFNSSMISGKSKLINILVLGSSISLDKYTKDRIIQLRDYILSKDCILIVIYEEETEKSLNVMGQFVEEDIRMVNPNFISIACYQDQYYRTKINGTGFENLNESIHDIWNGTLRYFGPTAGLQRVNLELMRYNCWNCKKSIKKVTGVVFPDQQLKQWDNADWLYYNQLLPLAKLDADNGLLIGQYADRLRTKTTLITPVSYRFSRTEGRSYLAASCPNCSQLQGNFHVSDERMQYLHNIGSRFDGGLQYYSIQLAVNYRPRGHLIFLLKIDIPPHSVPVGG